MSVSIVNRFQARHRLIYALVAMARPSQLGAVTVVYLLGVAIARAHGHAPGAEAMVWGYAALVLVSASIHYANEYADADTDALTRRTLFSGGSGALPNTGLDRRLALGAAWAALSMGVLVALAGAVTGVLGGQALALLVIGAVFGWMYSLPPLQLAWRGWGELDNAFLGGMVLALYGFAVVAGRIGWPVVLAMAPFTAVVFVNLLATTWPDRLADKAVGKLTLATRWPRTRLRRLYGSVALAAVLALLALTGVVLPPLVTLASVIAFPLLLWGGLAYTRKHHPAPTVFAMMALAFAQLAAWWWVG